MELQEAIKTRRSTRKFKSTPVEKEKVEAIIQAGRLAPSGGNTQTTHFMVVTNPDVLSKLVKLVQEEYGKMPITDTTLPYMVNIIKSAAEGKFVFNYGAPMLVIMANKRDYGNNFADVACAMQNMMLTANELDLANVWVNQLRWLCDNERINTYLKEIGLHDDEMVCASLAVGYSDLPDGKPVRVPGKIKGYEVTYIDSML